MAREKYRADVDGLRAVAVLMVILFHSGLAFSGGYVGVDVFFVISGYLITGIIVGQQMQGSFSLKNFWMRRIRRILPASIVMVIVTLFAGVLLLLPRDLDELGKSAVAQQFIASNFFFWHHTGYFDSRADLKPLLHTWSLAVEEQFYLVYPLLLVLCQRMTQKNLFQLLSALTLGSFCLACYLVYEHAGATFYATPTRAWELSIGGLLALIETRLIWSRGLREFAGLLGLGLVCYAAFTFNKETVFPGANALLPCFGAVLIIAASASGPTFVKKVLSFKPIVFIGLISYSLYLWHWPVLVYQRYWFGDNTSVTTMTIILLFCFLMSTLSWKFIEQPFRSSGTGESIAWSRVCVLVGSGSLLAFASAAMIILGDGLPSRVPENVKAILKNAAPPRDLKAFDREAHDCEEDHLPFIGDLQSTAPQFLVWGDSHARAIKELCDELAKEAGVKGAIATKSGTPPLVGPWRPSTLQSAVDWNNAVRSYIQRHHIKHVLLVGRWSTCIQHRGKDSTQEFSDGLRDTVNTLLGDGIEVRIMLQVPEQIINPYHRLAIATWGNVPIPRGVSKSQHEKTHANVFKAIEYSGLDKALFLDPTPNCFSEDGFSKLADDEVLYYRDDDHLSTAGADKLLRDLLRPFFVSIHD